MEGMEQLAQLMRSMAGFSGSFMLIVFGMEAVDSTKDLMREIRRYRRIRRAKAARKV